MTTNLLMGVHHWTHDYLHMSLTGADVRRMDHFRLHSWTATMLVLMAYANQDKLDPEHANPLHQFIFEGVTLVNLGLGEQSAMQTERDEEGFVYGVGERLLIRREGAEYEQPVQVQRRHLGVSYRYNTYELCFIDEPLSDHFTVNEPTLRYLTETRYREELDHTGRKMKAYLDTLTESPTESRSA